MDRRGEDRRTQGWEQGDPHLPRCCAAAHSALAALLQLSRLSDWFGIELWGCAWGSVAACARVCWSAIPAVVPGSIIPR